MCTIITRSPRDYGGFSFSDDARKRVREHLISVGIREECFQPIIWPEGAVSAYRPHMYAPWKFTTKTDILREKRERMEHNLRWKREYGVTQKRPLYVWVFWCPGLFGFAYRGWWLNLIGRDIESGKYFEGSELCSKVMELFPLIEPSLYGPPDIKEWKAEFVRRYQRGIWCGKPQGKAPIWAEVKGDSIEKILGRAEWPTGRI